jgi:SAM-dependent methyltransferase
MLEEVCTKGEVFGMDLFGQGLQFARSRTKCHLIQGDIYSSPFGTNFEVISLFDVIEHLPDDLKVLQTLYTMLSPGGTLLLTVPAFPSLWSYFDEAAHHHRRYKLADLENKLVQTGYQVEYLSYFMTSLFPLTWLVRKISALWSRFSKKTNQSKTVYSQAEQELRIVPVVNEILRFFFYWEIQVIKHHYRLPFGTSLLAVARKPA